MSAGPARLELHTHLEGSVTPRRLIQLGERHGESARVARCLNAAGDAYVFDGFAGFLNLYKDVTLLLKTPRDFHAVALDLGEALERDRVGYAEVSLSYGVMRHWGLDPYPIQQALHEAACRVEAERGVRLRWIPDATRQWGLDAGYRAFEVAAKAGRALGVVGFGLGGDEGRGPARDFAPLFADARREGLGVTIHAGEVPAMGPQAAADSVRQAVEDCGATRIGHGLAVADDALVMALLAARGVYVELCPGSNLRTGAIDSLAQHPLQAFLQAGIPCGLNPDDRTLFGLDMSGELEAARRELGLTREQERWMRERTCEAAFADPA
ncbi:hypothetical protein CSA17_03730 [bacterium DOLJORAL78_65_58]|nr:MAG: hypothetical protein CSB20_04675 [bacterium DOLZORAL124_64_63]PIE76151.1 MAG: hypothetical protein CSA17_03730 [bacterium DOLJORAL78_65_58]